jgi:hypothetical protein
MRQIRRAAVPVTLYTVKTRLARDLRARYWLRGHAFTIGLLTLLAAWGTSHVMMWLGNDALGWRYAAALSCAYGVYLLLMWVWCHQLVHRRDSQLDLPSDLPLPSGPSGGASGDAPPQVFQTGGAGDFSGGGASASFDAPGADGAAEVVSDVSSKALGAAFEADEGVVIAVPVVLTVVIAAALVTGLGIAFMWLFGVEVLLALVVELAFSTTAGMFAYRAWHEGWLWVALGKTVKPILALVILGSAAGFAIDYWMPHAQSLPHVLKLLF